MSSHNAAFHSAPEIVLADLTKDFGTHIAVNHVRLIIPAGRLTVFLGPSGCGKSTLLRLIAGIETPSAGQIEIGGRPVNDLPPSKRDIAMVFQNYALFPHLNVAQNIVFGLALRRAPKVEIAAQLSRVARMIGLEAFLQRKPAELSGGQQQRVALARAIISQRHICLMDEPLSNLDAKLRAEMRIEIRALQRRLGLTMVYVTHDQIEAMAMADQIVLLENGQVSQVGTPAEIYARPANTFAARFIGTPPMNLCPAQDLGLAGDRIIGLRPEDLALAETGPGPLVSIADVEFVGADRLISVVAGGSMLVLRQPGRVPVPTGAEARLSWHPAALHHFDPTTGAALPDPSAATVTAARALLTNTT